MHEIKSAYGLERFNASFHQKTSWVEEHCYELLHGKKTEMNIINNYYTLNNIKIIIQILFLLFIYLLNYFALNCFCSLKTRYATVLTPTKPSCFHRFFNIGLLPERLLSCSFGF